ncbi:MAG: ABC-type transporter, integral rane subunit [Chloroflexi bacterium]|nr:ABC-type transporter, integral rane subunit [Chloroflexota bacterium]
MENVAQVLLIGVIVGALYGLAALGFGLIMGVMKFVNIAHGSFIILGGFICYWIFTLLHVDPYLSIPLVMIAMFIVGIILYRLIFSPLLKLPRPEMRLDKSLLITFGVIWMLDNLEILFWTPNSKSVITSYGFSTVNIFGAGLSYTGLIGLGLAVLAAVGLYIVLTRTYFGKHVRAATEDSGAASLSGVNVQRTYLISCGIAAALAGLAGIVVVTSYSVTPGSGLNWLLTAMVVVVLAGEGNITYLLPAGIILGLIQSASTLFISPAYQQPIALIIFILIIIFRPHGLFARR